MVFFQIKLQLNILFFKELFINLILLFSTLFSSLPPFYLPCSSKAALRSLIRSAKRREAWEDGWLRRKKRSPACGYAERSAGSARQEPSKRVKKELRLPKTGIEPVSNSYKGFVLTVKLFRLLFFFLFLVLFRPIWGPERRNTLRSALPQARPGREEYL